MIHAIKQGIPITWFPRREPGTIGKMGALLIHNGELEVRGVLDYLFIL